MAAHEHERDVAPETTTQAPAAQPLVAPGPTAAATTADRVLALQRTAGNRAVGSTLGRTPAAPEALARKPTQVTTYQRDGKYGIAGRFQVDLDGNEAKLVIKAKIVPGANVTKAEADQVKADTLAAFERFWDGKFILTDTKTHEEFFLRVNVEYVDKGQHTTIRLLQNKTDKHGAIIDGRDDQTTWYVHSISVDRAHELSHQLGLRDEYIDKDVPRRRNASAAGVFQDHSLLGNYYSEGRDLAEVKLRHGEELARYVGKATKRTFSVKLSGYFQGERLVRWRTIAAGAAAGSAAKTAADAEVKAIEHDMMLDVLAPVP